MRLVSNLLLMVAGKTVLKDMLLVAGVLLVTTSLLMAYRKRRRRMATDLTPHEQIERMQQQRGMRGDLEDLMVEIEQLAKRMGSQLDAKSIQLERLLAEADRRIEQLQSLSKKVGCEDRWSNSPNSSVPQKVVFSNVDPPNDALAKSIYAMADQGLESDEIAKRLDELVGKVELILALRRP